MQSFVNGTDWANEASMLERIAKVTKQQVVDLANKYLRDDNYALIYKRQGKDPNEKKIDKPHITPIEPVFLVYTKDLTQLTAKEGMITRLRTDRITGMSVIWSYLNAQDLGQTVDSRIKLYNDIQTMTLDDVAAFQQQWVKGRTYYYGILGNKQDLDMEALKKIGPVTELTTEDIFGY